MMERDQKRVLDKIKNWSLTPQTKRVVAWVHTKVMHRDLALTAVVECYEDVQSSQEITSTYIKHQRAMEE